MVMLFCSSALCEFRGEGLGMSGWQDLVGKLEVLISMGGVGDNNICCLLLFGTPWCLILYSNKVLKVCCMGKLRALNPIVHSKSARNQLFMVLFYILVC